MNVPQTRIDFTTTKTMLVLPGKNRTNIKKGESIMTRTIKNGTLCLILLGFFGVNAPPLQAARDCQTVRQDLSKLKGLIERKNFLEVAVSICPDDPVIAYYYAYNFDRRQQFDKALGLYEKAAALNEHYAKPHFGMGDIYLIKGKMKEAISAYETGLVIDPKNTWAKRQLDDIRALSESQPTFAKKESITVEKPEVVEPKPLATPHDDTSKIARIDLSDLTEIAEKAEKASLDTEKAGEDALNGKTAAILASAELVSAKNGQKTGPVICKTDLSKLPSGDVEGKAVEKKKATQPDRIMDISPEDFKTTYTINFRSDSSLLTDEAKEVLDSKVCKIMQHPSMQDSIFEVAGYADSAGSFDLNMSVSRFRAYVVKNYLVNQCNIPEERLYLLYFGETNLLVPDTTPENRYKNRRVEIQLLEE